ncbi:AfsR/SARP family transcriptional regulator [Pseudonocardia spinosispora]|uniref:AfsR/SARP family transcriptional regulator n=1 Tax=Pseudonocardia spinosispora TaxID=103441 RepID=UPI0004090A6E|nr:AfsR/SARP family transcriptional regulator [Pseudonocardia spinosispora]
MDALVLGSLVLQHGDRQAVPTARKPRQVLSLLVLNEGDIVPTTSLLRELWDERPPRSAMTTLQTYVLQLRKLLAEALGTTQAEVARDVLRTGGTGYQLCLPGTVLDLEKYRGLERAGQHALEASDDDAATDLFSEALALWRGRALGDVEHGPMLRAEAARLEQSRLTMVECRLEAELRLGRHRESLSELAALVVQHSYNENLYAQYMLALYRSGCRTRALDIYRRLRASMVDELGLEPSPRLQRLQRAVLTAAPHLDDVGGGRWSSVELVGQPAQRGA